MAQMNCAIGETARYRHRKEQTASRESRMDSADEKQNRTHPKKFGTNPIFPCLPHSHYAQDVLTCRKMQIFFVPSGSLLTNRSLDAAR